MGDYTGLRCQVIIKEEFVGVVELITEECNTWLEVYNYFPQYGFLKEYDSMYASSFIPNGVLSYMPSSWDDNSYFYEDFDRDSRLWRFQCSLKNEGKTIEKFFELVLSRIAEQVIHLEYYYEYDDRSTFYDLQNGSIVKSDRKGVLYKQK